MPPPLIRWELAARVMVGVIVVATGVGALVVALGPGRSTTYTGPPAPTATLTFVAGLALAVAGLLLALVPRTRRLGDLSQVAAFVWSASQWVGWDGGPPLVRSTAAVVAVFGLTLVMHVVLAYPHGQVPAAVERALIAVAYAGAGVVALVTALFADPFSDPSASCVPTCPDNVFLVHSFPDLVRRIEGTDRWFTVIVATAFVLLCLRRIVAGSRPTHSILIPVEGPAVLLAAGLVAHALEHPSSAESSHSALDSAAVVLLGMALAWGALRPLFQRREVARIVANLGTGPAPGRLESDLGRAVGDPDLRIAYLLPGSREYVDAHGQPVPEPTGSARREVTTLVRSREQVALVSHTPGLSGLQSAMGAAVSLALENERLQAAGLAQLEELRTSRTRIIDAGDAERQRLERDLHDGAQQLLLAASYELRLARSAALGEADPETETLLASVVDETHAALEDLRQLAHGIYPAILGEAGLAAALASLADTAPVLVRTSEVSEQRFPPSIENAAYLVVAEAVEDAMARDANEVTVTALATADDLVVEVRDDGTPRNSSMTWPADRIGALGGSLDVGPTTLTAEIPCV